MLLHLSSMIRVTINGKTLTLPKPVTVLEAARIAQVEIPTLCFLEGLTPWGGCRLCLVEIEKIPRLQTACTTLVAEGMVVHTETEEVIRARRAILEFLLINHPLDCPICDKAGECELQDAVLKYGPSYGRFKERKRDLPQNMEDPLIVRNIKRCILCTRCIRTCQELQGADAISVINRGDRSVVEPFSCGRFDCEYCGNCLSACPVGALVSRLHLHEYRPWMVETLEGLCGFCGVGCNILFQRRGNSIVRTWSELKPEEGGGISLRPNNGLTCYAGRFGYDFLKSDKRLGSAFIKIGDTRYTVPLEDAVKRAAEALLEIKNKYGAHAIAAIGGGRLTNEDAYLFGKLIRGLGSNNIDSVARLGYLQIQQFFEDILGPGATANLIHGIKNSEVIVVGGVDPIKIAPVFGIHIRQAYLKGAKVLTIGFCPGLKRHTTWCEDRDESTVIEELASAILLERGVPETGQIDLIKRLIDALGLKDIKPSGRIREIAIEISKSQLCSLVTGPELLQKPEGIHDLLCLGVIAALLDARVYVLPSTPNDQGLIDMGLVPELLPGGRDLAVPAWRSHVENIWGVSISSHKGKTLYEIFELIEESSIKALYIAGVDPVTELPGGGRIKKGLEGLELLIVQEPFFTPAMELAHIGIPVCTWLEREGSFTNQERRLQFFKPIIEKTLWSDWEVFLEMGKIMGVPMPYTNSADIWDEICAVSRLHREPFPSTPPHRGVSKAVSGKLWPYGGEPLRSSSSITETWFKARDASFREVQKAQGPKIIVEKSPLLSATISRYSKALSLISGGPFARMSLKTAESLQFIPDREVSELTDIVVKGPHGEFRLPLRIDDSVPDGVVYLPAIIAQNNTPFTITDFSVNPAGAPVWIQSIQCRSG